MSDTLSTLDVEAGRRDYWPSGSLFTVMRGGASNGMTYAVVLSVMRTDGTQRKYVVPDEAR